MSDSVRPHGLACQAPLSTEFSSQEYWSGLPFPSPGDLPDPGIEPGSPALWADSLPSEPPGKLQLFFMAKYIMNLICILCALEKNMFSVVAGLIVLLLDMVFFMSFIADL